MSKAFTSDDVATPEAQLPLPVGRRPVTPGGMARLRQAHASLLGELGARARPSAAGVDEAQRQVQVLGRRLRHLERCIELSDVAPAPGVAPEQVALGTRVEVRDEDDGVALTYVLVGPDEVDVARRFVSYASPVGRALMGRKVGERTFIKRPAGTLEVVVERIAAEPDCSPA